MNEWFHCDFPAKAALKLISQSLYKEVADRQKAQRMQAMIKQRALCMFHLSTPLLHWAAGPLLQSAGMETLIHWENTVNHSILKGEKDESYSKFTCITSEKICSSTANSQPQTIPPSHLWGRIGRRVARPGTDRPRWLQ